MNALARWGRFNLVGAAGTAIQLTALAVLNPCWNGHYLAATAAALEITLLHNFVWHVRYTWRDRYNRQAWPQQLMRFHLSNGLVSMTGNLALMPLLVNGARLPIIAANAIAILFCSIANYCLGNNWAFAARA